MKRLSGFLKKVNEGINRVENLGASAAGGLIHQRKCPVTGNKIYPMRGFL